MLPVVEATPTAWSSCSAGRSLPSPPRHRATEPGSEVSAVMPDTYRWHDCVKRCLSFAFGSQRLIINQALLTACNAIPPHPDAHQRSVRNVVSRRRRVRQQHMLRPAAHGRAGTRGVFTEAGGYRGHHNRPVALASLRNPRPGASRAYRPTSWGSSCLATHVLKNVVLIITLTARTRTNLPC